ncbi:TetR/AcrR family transcriptional regulator [Paenibacillus sp. DMB20]|uniref:TetR/AcrR family transcriptional regulator n=1 Tax=Paenibacillus sp. DMB20 TaxID=1642570 RepID=UPI0006278427|nr:TetR/AcrR family transcriptional regulator [Paenibacillus sp. DMB20]KKO52995.1 TetR family transcriptional regulator [Paenibacillus sp. DMB20]KKO53510.1 TetR family transcriptional regulator [Paenibacillus sp. DMB20]
MARRAVERELSRERILEAARHLFITKGYRAISMRSIGQHLGYSHGSLYYHFKEKAELFYAIVMKDFNDLALLLHEAAGKAPSDGISKLEQLLLEFVRFGLDHPYQYEIMFMIRDEELLAYCRTEQSRCFDMFSALVRKHLLEDVFSEEERRNLPLTLFLSTHGFVSFYIQDRVSFDEIKPAAIAHVKALCRGFTAKSNPL